MSIRIQKERGVTSLNRESFKQQTEQEYVWLDHTRPRQVLESNTETLGCIPSISFPFECVVIVSVHTRMYVQHKCVIGTCQLNQEEKLHISMEDNLEMISTGNDI